jgi:hypothetical protein
MRFGGCLIVSVLLITGCVERPDQALLDQEAVSTSSLLSSDHSAQVTGPFCAASFCDEFSPCPFCDGTRGTCGPDGLCAYNRGGGGGGGGGGPFCASSLCADVNDCFASCPQATTASCVAGACVY